MAQRIPSFLDDASGAGIEITLIDSNGDTVTAAAISTIEYTWSDEAGIVINSRQDVSVSVTNPVLIKLDKVDTAVTIDSSRLLTVTWIYLDTLLGVGTQKVREFLVPIENAVNK